MCEQIFSDEINTVALLLQYRQILKNADVKYQMNK
jgi:hypothetical protein